MQDVGDWRQDMEERKKLKKFAADCHHHAKFLIALTTN